MGKNEPKKQELSKNDRIKNELGRISVFFEEIDGNQKAIISPLIQNAAFMRITLDDLQEIINSEGVVDEYRNGANQYGIKQSATLQSYNALIKNYSAVIRTLSQYLPPEKKQSFPSPWAINLPVSSEEREQKQEEMERKRKKEFDLAVEFQRLQREDENFAKTTSFSAWMSQQMTKEHDAENVD